MANPYPKNDPAAPFSRGAAVVPGDGTVIALTDALFVGGAGNLTVTMQDGSDLTLTGVTAGSVLPLAVTKVKVTGTTATSIAALYRNY
jgi:hypothetical protein